jgi:hypothetical protein
MNNLDYIEKLEDYDAEIQAAIEDVVAGRGLSRAFDNIKDLMEDLRSSDDD